MGNWESESGWSDPAEASASSGKRPSSTVTVARRRRRRSWALLGLLLAIAVAVTFWPQFGSTHSNLVVAQNDLASAAPITPTSGTTAPTPAIGDRRIAIFVGAARDGLATAPSHGLRRI